MSQEINISRQVRTPIGIKPLRIGWSEFCIGIEAISEIIKVITSSEVSSSPICRLPINFIAQTTTIYIIIARKKEVNILNPELNLKFIYNKLFPKITGNIILEKILSSKTGELNSSIFCQLI